MPTVNGKYLDPVKAAAAWKANTNAAKAHRGGLKIPSATPEVAPATPQVAAPRPPDRLQSPRTREEIPQDWTKNRAITEFWKGEQARLEVEEQLGRLLDAEEVRRRDFNAARACRDHFRGIPNRVSSILATIDDPAQINRLLTQEIDEGCRGFARALGAEITE